MVVPPMSRSAPTDGTPVILMGKMPMLLQTPTASVQAARQHTLAPPPHIDLYEGAVPTYNALGDGWTIAEQYRGKAWNLSLLSV